MKKLLLLTLLACVLFLSATALAEQTLGYVNPDTIIKQSVKLQKIALNFANYQAQIIADFEKEKPTLSQEAVKLKAEGYQDDINMREQIAAARIDGNIRAAIKIVAKKYSLDVVTLNTVAVYGCRDITSDVISTIDAGQD